MVLGALSGWPLDHRLAFHTACSALAIQQFGGSLAAPCGGDIADWWHGIRSVARMEAHHVSLVRRYGFLDDGIPTGPIAGVRRAAATVARLSDVGPHLTQTQREGQLVRFPRRAHTVRERGR